MAANVTYIPPKAAKPEALRVAAYCRVSSDSSDQLHSYATQIKAYTEQIGAHTDWELVDVYADEGLTGTRMDKREDFQRLLADCRKGKVDRVLCKSISRFARNTKDCLAALRELSALGVTVYFEKENIDTGTLTSELMVSVSGALAQQESISISQNLKIAWRRMMAAGDFVTTNPPFGYELVDGCGLRIKESEADIVRWIFASYLDGISTREIAKSLTERGILTTEGNAVWNPRSVQLILDNEKYKGDTFTLKRYTTNQFPFAVKRNHGEVDQYYIENSHPAIINTEMALGSSLKKRTSTPSPSPANSSSPCSVVSPKQKVSLSAKISSGAKRRVKRQVRCPSSIRNCWVTGRGQMESRRSTRRKQRRCGASIGGTWMDAACPRSSRSWRQIGSPLPRLSSDGRIR